MHVLLCGRMPGLLNQLQGMLEQQGHSSDWVLTDADAIAKLQEPNKYEAVWIAPPYSSSERKKIQNALPSNIQSFQVMHCCPADLGRSVAKIDAQLTEG